MNRPPRSAVQRGAAPRPDAMPAAAAAADAAPVPSPCNKVCTIDARSGWCEGCRRTLDEIVAWPTLSDDAKRAVWSAIAQRGGPRPASPSPSADAPRRA